MTKKQQPKATNAAPHLVLSWGLMGYYHALIMFWYFSPSLSASFLCPFFHPVSEWCLCRASRATATRARPGPTSTCSPATRTLSERERLLSLLLLLLLCRGGITLSSLTAGLGLMILFLFTFAVSREQSYLLMHWLNHFCTV